MAASHIDYNWFAKDMKRWSAYPESSLLMVQGSWNSKMAAKSLAVSLVKLIRKSNCPVIWALRSSRIASDRENQISRATY